MCNYNRYIYNIPVLKIVNSFKFLNFPVTKFLWLIPGSCTWYQIGNFKVVYKNYTKGYGTHNYIYIAGEVAVAYIHTSNIHHPIITAIHHHPWSRHAHCSRDFRASTQLCFHYRYNKEMHSYDLILYCHMIIHRMVMNIK